MAGYLTRLREPTESPDSTGKVQKKPCTACRASRDTFGFFGKLGLILFDAKVGF